VISDTHGLLRPEALAALAGSDVIIHAGDVGSPEVIERLRAIAPTFAVRGNNDTASWADDLPEMRAVTVGGLRFWVVHEAARVTVDPVAARLACVVTGHSHRPSIQTRDGILHLNPGSAGPRRFTLPITLARIHIAVGRLHPEIIHLPT
jgi:uncharacterized protein